MRKLLALPLLALLLFGCSEKRPILRAFADPDRNLPPKSAEKLLAHLGLQTTTPQYSTKADIALTMPDGSKKSFKAYLRSNTDSAMWVSIVPALGIEVARALITTDSVKVLDRLGDKYWVGSRSAAKEKFGMDPDLRLLQYALFGLAIGLDSEEHFRSDREDGQYVLVSKERRRFVRAAEDLQRNDSLADDRDLPERRLERTLRRAERKDAVVHKYWLNADSLWVDRVLISDLARDQHADVRYTSRTWVNGRSVPATVVLSLSDPQRTVTANVSLDRISLDGPLQFPFRIPEKFTPME